MKEEDLIPIMCPRCAKSNAPMAPFCEHCGTPLSEMDPSANMFYQNRGDRPRTVSAFSYWAIRLAMLSALFIRFANNQTTAYGGEN